MKSKILKTLESTKTVLLITFFIALMIGFLVYKFVGYAPKNLAIQKITEDNLLLENQTVDLAFPKTGRVNTVNVQVGQTVKKGEVLVSLDSEDARGSLAVAKANYQKVLNGATGPDIEVARAAVKIAQVNFEATVKQQKLAVHSAYRNLLNSTLEAIPKDNTKDYVAPTISGTYLLDQEGEIDLSLYYSTGGVSFNVSGLVQGSGMSDTITPQPIGNSGLYIKFPSSTNFDQRDWVIVIPNKKAPNYLANYNAYQAALDTEKRSVELAQAGLDQANSALALKVAAARPEDVAAAEGALAVAQGAYNNNFIYAPSDGVVTGVNANVGEIVLANQRVISLQIKK